jgi:hypothetical protein
MAGVDRALIKGNEANTHMFYPFMIEASRAAMVALRGWGVKLQLSAFSRQERDR